MLISNDFMFKTANLKVIERRFILLIAHNLMKKQRNGESLPLVSDFLFSEYDLMFNKASMPERSKLERCFGFFMDYPIFNPLPDNVKIDPNPLFWVDDVDMISYSHYRLKHSEEAVKILTMQTGSYSFTINEHHTLFTLRCRHAMALYTYIKYQFALLHDENPKSKQVCFKINIGDLYKYMPIGTRYSYTERGSVRINLLQKPLMYLNQYSEFNVNFSFENDPSGIKADVDIPVVFFVNYKGYEYI